MLLEQTTKIKLIDSPKNREKATVLNALEIALDDIDNPHIFSDALLSAEAGVHFPWGTEFEITVKVKLPTPQG